MENFVIRDRGALVIRLLQGVLLMIIGISMGFRYIERHGTFDFIMLILLCATGLFILFGGFRPERAEIKMIQGGIWVKWINWYFGKRFYNLLIESIHLGSSQILIKIHGRKPAKLRIGSFSARQKEKIRTYFIRYSSANKIKVFRHF